MSLSTLPFADYFERARKHVESFYGIKITIIDVPSAYKADLDGAQIYIDPKNNAEDRFFILAHCFGHTVQWNTDPRSLEAMRDLSPPLAEDRLLELKEYEHVAVRLALTMLNQIGIVDIDQWLSDYSACDIKYLFHYYRTGERREFKSFWCKNTKLVMPLPIPAFIPRKQVFQTEGVVI